VSKDAWSDVIRDLVSQGYLIKSDGTYPILKLTPKSAGVLKGSEKVMLTKTKEKIDAAEPLVEYEKDLFEQLKEVRRKIAQEENVPAYIVLSDATLMEIAEYLPHNKEEFLKISGFGQVKIERYGKQFWEVVANYCRNYNLKSRIHLKTPKRIRKERPEKETDTKQQSLELFKLGHSVLEIAQQRNLSLSTVETHLSFYIQQGTLSINDAMDAWKIPHIQKAIEDIGGKALGPLKQALGDDYSYGEIRMVMAHLEWMKAQQ
jgi:Superfamily II DNA helicase